MELSHWKHHIIWIYIENLVRTINFRVWDGRRSREDGSMSCNIIFPKNNKLTNLCLLI